MTEAPEQTEPEVQPLADLPLAGPAAFITLRDITFASDANNIYVRCTTDIATLLTFRTCRTKDPNTIYTETESPTPILGMRYQTLPRSNLGPADYSGETVLIEISTQVPPNSVGSPYLRPYTGSLRLVGARTVANGKALPVRFNGFSGSYAAAVPPLGTKGNWSTYTWSQWNTKGIA